MIQLSLVTRTDQLAVDLQTERMEGVGVLVVALLFPAGAWSQLPALQQEQVRLFLWDLELQAEFDNNGNRV